MCTWCGTASKHFDFRVKCENRPEFPAFTTCDCHNIARIIIKCSPKIHSEAFSVFLPINNCLFNLRVDSVTFLALYRCIPFHDYCTIIRIWCEIYIHILTRKVPNTYLCWYLVVIFHQVGIKWHGHKAFCLFSQMKKEGIFSYIYKL